MDSSEKCKHYKVVNLIIYLTGLLRGKPVKMILKAAAPKIPKQMSRKKMKVERRNGSRRKMEMGHLQTRWK